jgi:molybdopterin molybdotransferase
MHRMVPVPEALETVLSETAKSLWENGSASTQVATLSSDLVGQISATVIRAPHPGYPNYNSSIMDGYAVKTTDLVEMKKRYDGMDEKERINFRMDFVLEGKVFAGDNVTNISCNDNNGSSNEIYPTAVYVTTGAVVPTEYDAVIPVEDTIQETENEQMRIIDDKVASVLATTTPWTWIRPIGCDIAPDSIVLSEGERIQPVHMALLTQCGVDQIPVKCFPKVGILSTGNELLISTNNKDQCQHGKIPDANRPLLLSQLETYGNCKPHDLGIVSDDDSIEILSDKLKNALWNDGIDVIISTGGISMGEKDNMEQVFVEGMGGKIHFGRMNMKPGKPTTFITIDKETSDGKFCRKHVFALPGNPVSASVCTELLVRPCLDLLHHGVDTSEVVSSLDEQSFIRHAVDNARVHDELMATLAVDVKLDKGRPEYHRVSIRRAPSLQDKLQYSYHATSTGVQRSSRVLSLRSADGLMMLPRGGQLGCGKDVAQKGNAYPVLLYQSSSYSMRCGTRFKESMHRRMLEQKIIESSEKMHLGIVVCTSDREEASGRLDKVNTTLMNSLGGEDHVKTVSRVVCNTDASYDVILQRLNDTVCGADMENANVIFVVVLGNSGQDDNPVPFRTGLDLSHALRQMVTKHADAMAMRLRQAAASQDALAALFANVVGLVRNESSVLISCSERGLGEAGIVIRSSLNHLVAMLKK